MSSFLLIFAPLLTMILTFLVLEFTKEFLDRYVDSSIIAVLIIMGAFGVISAGIYYIVKFI
ncbi:hypothetical protein BAMA_04715 [Bacillus manliponensis]|uniref:Uncharacterized protein n=1 Tax=Bacillus manliponensis TaxID=574376 RepID=A0A073JW99_9BACI|nr:hypothetical protein BAMA_04715 [Bacillus manliponensis]